MWHIQRSQPPITVMRRILHRALQSSSSSSSSSSSFTLHHPSSSILSRLPHQQPFRTLPITLTTRSLHTTITCHAVPTAPAASSPSLLPSTPPSIARASDYDAPPSETPLESATKLLQQGGGGAGGAGVAGGIDVHQLGKKKKGSMSSFFRGIQASRPVSDKPPAVALTHYQRKAKTTTKKTKSKPLKIFPPLLARIWGPLGYYSELSPEDWSNVVFENRQKILEIKEREQYRAWKIFQKMKKDKMEWLKNRGEVPSEDMLVRIKDRELKIMNISAKARAQLTAPLPPIPRGRGKERSEGSIKRSAKARSEPQVFLKTTFPTKVWRKVTFKLTHYHSHILYRQMEKFRQIAKKLGLSPSHASYLPHKIKRWTIIRSPHVDKTSREQFETRFYSLKIHFSPQVEKFYAIHRLMSLAFRLFAGNVRMRVETPPNAAIETLTFAPDPTKPVDGYLPPQRYAELDSPGIESILYKLDQHPFRFLVDWEEEILDEQYRGIYAPGRQIAHPYPMAADFMNLADREKDAAEAEAAALGKGKDGNDEGAALSPGGEIDHDATKEETDHGIFDEEADFEEGEDELFNEDDDDDVDLEEKVDDIFDEKGVPKVDTSVLTKGGKGKVKPKWKALAAKVNKGATSKKQNTA